MSKTETWVQRYRPQIEPGPDGAPVNVSELFWPSDLGAEWRGFAPYVERETTREIRGGRLTQKWRRYLVKDWSQFP